MNVSQVVGHCEHVIRGKPVWSERCWLTLQKN